MVGRVLLVICLIHVGVIFSGKIVFNSYDNTLLISDTKETFSFTVSANLTPFRTKGKFVYTPPKVKGISHDLPEGEILVLENLVTIGPMGTDIVVSKEVFQKLKERVDFEYVCGYYPVEVLSNEIVLVKERVEKKDLREYLSCLLDRFELPKVVSVGTLKVTPTPPQVSVLECHHVEWGSVFLLKVEDDSPYDVYWNGEKGKLWFHTREPFEISLKVVDAFGEGTETTLSAKETFSLFAEHTVTVWCGEEILLPDRLAWFFFPTGSFVKKLSCEFPGKFHLLGFDGTGYRVLLRLHVIPREFFISRNFPHFTE